MASQTVDEVGNDAAAPAAESSTKEQLNAHTFAQVAIARGSKWAEASMAALHKKERAQAVQILQLKQDVERFKTMAESSGRELAELKQQNREQVREPTPTATVRTGGGGVALPRLGSRHSTPSTEELHPRTRSRGTRSRPDSAVAPPRGVAADAESSGGDSEDHGSGSRPSTREKLIKAKYADLESRCAELEARRAELEAEVEASRASLSSKEAELRDARAEVIRVTSKYENRVSAAASVQHRLEGRLAEKDAELDEAKCKCGRLEEEIEKARAEGRAAGASEAERRLREPEELISLRKERVALKQEAQTLRQQLEVLGGRIKTLTGQTEETSAEQRSFLRTLTKMQKEQQRELERESSDVAATIHERAERRKQQMAAKLEAIVKRHEASEAARAEILAVKEDVAAAAVAAAESPDHAAAVGLDDPTATSSALSPRRAEKQRRPPQSKYQMIAELDPEGAERRKAIDALKQRMKAID